MKQSGRLSGIGAAVGVLLLILDGKTALRGASEGLELCIRTVIPSLFPFFVLVPMLTGSLLGRRIWVLRRIGRLTGIPEGAEPIFLSGLLGGYPIGAGCIDAAMRQGQLSRWDARRMMGFCSNAGPSFLFGIAGAMFPQKWAGWALWGIHILSAVLVGAVLPGRSRARAGTAGSRDITLPGALRAAVGSMALVCGWVVLFRVVIAFLDRWFLWLVPDGVRVVICGLLELTNGCCALNGIGNTGLRFVICAGMLSFGGLCVAMQTANAAQEVGLGAYFPGKLLQSLFSILLSLAVQPLFPQGVPIHPLLPLGVLIFLLVLGFLPGKREISSSISAEVGV